MSTTKQTNARTLNSAALYVVCTLFFPSALMCPCILRPTSPLPQPCKEERVGERGLLSAGACAPGRVFIRAGRTARRVEASQMRGADNSKSKSKLKDRQKKESRA